MDIEYRSIELAELDLDLDNYRYPPRPNTRDALTKMAHHQNTKLAKLAKDIVRNGLNPTRRFLVTPSDDGGYVVLEGNRRLAALMLLANPELRSSLNLPSGIGRKFDDLAREAGATLPTTLDCAVVTRPDAKHWIALEHSGGENDGVSTVPWDPPARHRFRNTPALQAVDLVSAHLDESTRARLPEIYITNVERVLSTPEAREHLGVDLAGGKLSLRPPLKTSLGRLARLVSDVALEEIMVRNLDSAKQRIDYARAVAKNPLPLQAVSPSTPPKSTTKAAPPVRRVAVDRATLIPKSLLLQIPTLRVNKIYGELQRLRIVDDFENSAAVLLRVFVELSVDAYAAHHHIKLVVPPKPGAHGKLPRKAKDMSLRQKISTVAAHLEAAGVCDRNDLQGIRAVIAMRHHPLSLDSLHAYVHNRHYHPAADELKRTFDNIQPFIQGVWKS